MFFVRAQPQLIMHEDRRSLRLLYMIGYPETVIADYTSNRTARRFKTAKHNPRHPFLSYQRG